MVTKLKGGKEKFKFPIEKRLGFVKLLQESVRCPFDRQKIAQNSRNIKAMA